MSGALVLIVVGLVIGFAAFCFAAINMFRGVTGKDPFSGFDGMLKGHIGAIIAMAFGGLLFVIGLILAGVDVLSRLK
jgi:hypothetical protein